MQGIHLNEKFFSMKTLRTIETDINICGMQAKHKKLFYCIID